eukprot:TRINITY_DN3719_c0_g1_i1.p1 TRINITY_DN3719_c0_g1~~TRINITY_DN3719_c0_g1_i1.p1  ORF type:complete len:1693 (-),score=320.89 TRINITY_DN3719_c0_g1_i1:7-5085(-)
MRKCLEHVIEIHDKIYESMQLGTDSTTPQDQENDSSPFLSQFISRVMQLDWHSRKKLTAMEVLIPRLTVPRLVREYPRFLHEILSAMRHAKIRPRTTSLFGTYIRDVFWEASGVSRDVSRGNQADSIPANILAQGLPAAVDTYIVGPLLDLLGSADIASETRDAILTGALPSLAPRLPSVIYTLLQRLDTSSHGAPLPKAVLRVLVTLLSEGRSVNAVTPTFDCPGWKETDDVYRGRHVLDQALCHADEGIRIHAIGVVTRSRSLTSGVSQLECDMVLRFIISNISSTTSWFARDINDLMETFFVRCASSRRHLMRGGDARGKRRRQQQRQQEEEPESMDAEAVAAARKAARLALQAQVETIDAFHLDLAAFLRASMYPAAPAERRANALALYQALLLVVLADNGIVSPIATTRGDLKRLASERAAGSGNGSGIVEGLTSPGLTLDILCSNDVVQELMASLIDAWDHTRNATFQLLSLFPAPFQAYRQAQEVRTLVQESLALVDNVRQRSAESGALRLRLLLSKYVVDGWWIEVSHGSGGATVDGDSGLEQQGAILQGAEMGDNEALCPEDDSDIICIPPGQHDKTPAQCVTRFFASICDSVAHHVRRCQDTLPQGVMSAVEPAHGRLLAASYLVTDLNCHHRQVLHKSGLWSQWTQMFEDLVPILQEGIRFSIDMLPKSHTSVDSFEEPMAAGDGALVEGEVLPDDDTGAHAQVVMVCSWLLFKEGMSLLESMISCLSPTGCDQAGLLTVPEIVKVGTFMFDIILRTVHNGATQKAQKSLAFVSQFAHQSQDATIRALPERWLSRLLAVVADGDSYSFLRRSRSLVHAVRAILKSEGRSRLLLHKAATTLLGHALASESSEAQVVHSLNILTGIFREGGIGQASNPFVVDGFKAALKGFHSPKWPIQNSSQMLFSAVLTRSIGVRATQRLHTQGNGISPGEFLLRFPEMYQVLSSQMDDIVETTRRKGQMAVSPSLFPVLTVLSELTALSAEKAQLNDTQQPLQPFIDLLSELGGHSALQVRVAAAAALPGLCSADTVCDLIAQVNTTLSSILSAPQLESASFNRAHFTAVQLRTLLHACSNVEDPAMLRRLHCDGYKGLWLHLYHTITTSALFTHLQRRRIPPVVQMELVRVAAIIFKRLFARPGLTTPDVCQSLQQHVGQLYLFTQRMHGQSTLGPAMGLGALLRETATVISRLYWSTMQSQIGEAITLSGGQGQDGAFFSTLINHSSVEVRSVTLKQIAKRVSGVDLAPRVTTSLTAILSQAIVQPYRAGDHVTIHPAYDALCALARCQPSALQSVSLAQAQSMYTTTVTNMTQSRFDDFKLSCLSFISLLLRAHREADSEGVLDQGLFVRTILEFAHPSNSWSLRAGAILAIEQSAILSQLLQHPHGGRGLNPYAVDAWYVIIGSLQDDDPANQVLAARAVAACCHSDMAATTSSAGSTSPGTAMVQSLSVFDALDRAFEHLSTTIIASAQGARRAAIYTDAVDMFLHLLWGDVPFDTTNDFGLGSQAYHSNKLFEVEPDNLAAEPILLCQLTGRAIRRVIRAADAVDVRLAQSLSRVVSERCCTEVRTLSATAFEVVTQGSQVGKLMIHHIDILGNAAVYIQVYRIGYGTRVAASCERLLQSFTGQLSETLRVVCRDNLPSFHLQLTLTPNVAAEMECAMELKPMMKDTALPLLVPEAVPSGVLHA